MATPPHDVDEAITGINVTPLVDVVLVLLVVLMVTASFALSRSLPIETPSAEHHVEAPPRALDIALDANGHAFVDGAPVDDATLAARIHAYAATLPTGDARASLAADRAASHGDVVRVLDLLRGAEVTHVAIGVRPAP
jgi:biopolymer transport protein ExbD